MRAQQQATSVLTMRQEELGMKHKLIAHLVLFQYSDEVAEMLVRRLALQSKACSELNNKAFSELGICHDGTRIAIYSLKNDDKPDREICHRVASCICFAIGTSRFMLWADVSTTKHVMLNLEFELNLG